MPKYVIEYAKSGRGGCKGTCKDKIEKGALRLGSLSDAGGFDRLYWRHFPECMTGRVANNIIEALGSAEKIDGYEELEEADQKKVLKAFDELTKEGGGNAEKPAKKSKKKAEEDEDEGEEEEAPAKKPKSATKKTPAKKRAKQDEEDEGEEEKEEKEEKAKPKKTKAAASSKGKPKKAKAAAKDEDEDDE